MKRQTYKETTFDKFLIEATDRAMLPNAIFLLIVLLLFLVYLFFGK